MNSLSKPLISDLIYSYIFANYQKQGFACLQNGNKSYIFLEPYLRIWADSSGSYCKSLISEKKYSDIWQALKDCIKEQSRLSSVYPEVPCSAGIFTYELCSKIEQLNYVNPPLKNLPVYEFYLYRKVIEIEGLNLKQFVFHSEDHSKSFWSETQLSDSSPVELPCLTQPGETALSEIENKLFKYSNFTHTEYVNSVEEIIGYIRKGNVYQVNLSQQFTLPFAGDIFQFFYAYSKLCPAPYGSFLNFAGNYIISASPELFIRYDGSSLLTSPIKGTILRGENDISDISLLQGSPKDLSELTMITDIERNDLSKIARSDTVRVLNHARVQSTGQVHHLVSDITCKLRSGLDLVDVIRAMFPSGSITGAPKIAAMNYIAQTERTSRGVYTGSIGWFSREGNFSFNVAIRTAQVFKDKIFYSAGGGIIFDSRPEEEYIETLAKTKGFYLALKSILSDNC